ncbi:hypothetical protein ACG33_07125 [Steroidobacter denitrificans]|uniref:Lipopolysaccharide assembly protein A domain-containing protein n=1 Tax=Steroidobacter denitrificans TaxID=465721 RepID=A0A127F8Y0_STEDE|nr:lipopolysaccharide assembly protein LapA domain-containing protein [Steroidobacter denitrificans]AMN46872.1 hypothetical protein ACG33_07125 [Steroidobacter denitrificans]
MSRVLFLSLVVVLALAALLITAMNPVHVDLELAFIRITAPLGLVLVVALAVGLLAGLASRAYWIAALLQERGRLRRALRRAESSSSSNKTADDAG